MGRDLIATHFGDVVVTHGPQDCLPPCTIHSPSDHHMAGWPQHWNDELRIMQRVCPHMYAHPDPDDVSVRTRRSARAHECDGCCVPAE